MARAFVLVASLAMILLLGAVTVTELVDDGLNVRVLLSLAILGLLGTGVLGALLTGSSDDS
jgi:hypothetical protein